jgi:hypothetical protein
MKGDAVKAVVVYESLWGNTAAIPKAIAQGIGDGAQAPTTAEATPRSADRHGPHRGPSARPRLPFVIGSDPGKHRRYT